MATLSKCEKGLYTIQVTGSDRKRRSIRLGRINKKMASEIRTKVEYIHPANISGFALDAETAAWVAGIGDDLAEKLAKIKLIPNRVSTFLKDFLNQYIERRKADSKSSTVTNLETVRNDVLDFLI